MRKVERVVVLPAVDNEGESLAIEHNHFRDLLLTIAGGYSQTSQLGEWKDETGKVYPDESIRYTVLCSQAQDKAIAALLPELCEATRQECILTTRRMVDCAFVEKVTAPSLASAA